MYDSKKEKIIKCLFIFLASVIGIAICVFFGVYAYKHRVIERKQYSVVAVVTDKKHVKAYTTSRYDPNTKTIKTTRHPEKFYIYYSVSFEGATYADNRDKVTKSRYNNLSVGSEISCIFEKQ